MAKKSVLRDSPLSPEAAAARIAWLEHPVHEIYRDAIALSAALRGLQARVENLETDPTVDMLSALEFLATKIEAGLRDLPERADPEDEKAVA
jgi:hypothetical protein